MSSSLKILSDENKLSIILSLLESKTCVCELVPKLEIEQSLLSHHLLSLKRKKVLKSKKDGRKVFYCINDEWKRDFLENLQFLLIKLKGGQNEN
ncbi:MAG: hypothetical protein Fur0024_1230 [Patescibacteria group bacterium]